MEWKPTEQLVLDVLCPGNQLLTGRRNRPSVMVRIPALTYRQLGLGELDQTHPAFWVNGREVQAMPAARKDGRTTCVQTGTGPLTWSHNGEPSGIWDLNGNVGEWVSGLRLVCGELQILPNNDGADICNSQAANSLMWRAIHAGTGALILPAGGSRTAHSLKLDYRDGVWTWCAELRQDGAEEIFFGCGGHYGHGSEAGIFCIHATTKRTATSPSRGFRCAYAEF